MYLHNFVHRWSPLSRKSRETKNCAPILHHPGINLRHKPHGHTIGACRSLTNTLETHLSTKKRTYQIPTASGKARNLTHESHCNQQLYRVEQAVHVWRGSLTLRQLQSWHEIFTTDFFFYSTFYFPSLYPSYAVEMCCLAMLRMNVAPTRRMARGRNPA